MTNSQAYKLFMEIVALWSPSGRFEETEKRTWMFCLLKKDYSQTSALITKLYERRGEIDYDNLKKLLPAFKQAYSELAPSKSSWCPCCDGCGFIVFELAGGKTEAMRCHCRTGGLKNDDVCQNLYCQNPTRSAKMTFLAGYCEQFPWKVAGWRQCNYRPLITEVKHLHIPIVTAADKRVVGILFRAQSLPRNIFDFPHKAQTLKAQVPMIGEIG